MTEILTLEKIIAFLKVDLTFACCWPLPMKATKFQKIRDKMLRLFCCLNSIIMSISIIYTLNKKYDNLIFVMKVSCELSAFLLVPIQIIMYTFQSDHLQSNDIGYAGYESSWYSKDISLQKNLLHTVSRCQTPITLTVPCLLPTLSLKYYASIIIYEMEDYIQQAKSEERNIFQRYINKCKLFYGTTICFMTTTAIIMWFGPLLLPQPFPIEVEYPFDVNKQPLRTIIYLHHIMAVYQSRTQVCSNIFIALLLWFTAARFEILSHKFQKSTSTSEFIICIQLHQRLLRVGIMYNKRLLLAINIIIKCLLSHFYFIKNVLSNYRYAKNVTITVRYIVLTSIGFSTIAVVFSGLTFLSQQPLAIKTQFLAIATSALIEVFICAWPADYLFRTSNDIGYAGYESSWYGKDISLQKNLLHTVSRCQYPVTLTVPCLLPTLSLNYYASYLSTTFSYLTTFRAMLAEKDGLQT
ncbi:hypothetical protein ALC57_08493 [Trachymyrmex cornetzi]|uniref:Odorant receptor n=1 Tax=Trachymyrmex cornetzi TaxID=471704 RepID=A0A195E2K0_9HYME|nr:hypothetical protein ALC57_08493 [Trachymyrmex cornetzi]